ncbi:MAG: DUF3987 domain-containing protein [Planctomycetia bacterium]|nr:DUF3987 domain-containing protein [Planctomycetia bacterium]
MSFSLFDDQDVNVDNQTKKIKSQKHAKANSSLLAPCNSLTLHRDAFHGIPGEIVHSIAPFSEADPVALLVQLLVCCGSILGRTAHAMVEGHKHYLNLFVILVGKSSKARKGSSWHRVKQYLTEVDNDWLTHRVQSGLASGEGMTYAIRDSAPLTTHKKSSKKYQPIDPGIKDKRLLCIEEEFAGILRQCERQGSVLSARLREAWDGTPLGSMTKHSPTRCKEPHVSLIAHGVDYEIVRYLNNVEIANGLGNRLLWFSVQRSQCLPHGCEYTPDQRLVARLIEAIHSGRSRGLITRTTKADRLWESVYPQLSEGKPGFYGSLLNRAEAQVLRLSCLFAVLDQTAQVAVEHLKAALAIWNYCESSVKTIFQNKTGEPLADRIHKQLQKLNAMDRTQISAFLHHNKTAEEISEALCLLKRLGHVQMTKELISGGGVREIWSLTNVRNERNKDGSDST